MSFENRKDMSKKKRRLTGKQKAFIEAYLETLNATEAARRAGYKGNGNTLKSIGSENLTKPDIAALIKKRVASRAMKADEVLDRLAQQARGGIGELITEGGGLDIEKIQEQGHLVKSYSITKQGRRIELHSSQRALELLGKHHQLFTDKLKVEGEILIWDRTVPGETETEPE